jgi:hypothetical protein
MSNEMRAHAAVGEIHQVESRRTRGKGKVSYSDEVSVGYAPLMSFQSVERALKQIGSNRAAHSFYLCKGGPGAGGRRSQAGQ